MPALTFASVLQILVMFLSWKKPEATSSLLVQGQEKRDVGFQR